MPAICSEGLGGHLPGVAPLQTHTPSLHVLGLGAGQQGVAAVSDPLGKAAGHKAAGGMQSEPFSYCAVRRQQSIFCICPASV